MDSSQNSSFSSGQYATLLRTITELRSELEKTVSKIRLLEDQNQQLNANYFTVRDELDDTKRKYQEIRESYLSAVRDKFEGEKAQETLISKLRLQITEKTREFEVIREKLVPHDIDQLRIKVEEELEIRHKQELKAMELDVERERERFFLAQRECERVKVEYANAVNLLQSENKSLREEKEMLQDAWRNETLSLSVAGESGAVAEREDRLRALTARNHDIAHQLELQREEMKTLVKERDAAALELAQHKAKADGVQAALRADLARLEAERAGFAERLQILTNENERKEAIARNAKTACEEAYRLKDQAEKEKLDGDRYLDNLRHENDLQFEAMRENHALEVRDLRDAIAHLQAKLQEREEYSRRVQRETSEMQLRAESMEGELRRAHLVIVQELKKKHALVELDLADTKYANKSLEEQLETVKEQYVLEKDTVASELARIRREKDVLHGKLREYEANLEASRKKALQAQQDQLAKIAVLEKQTRELQTGNAALAIKLDAQQSKYLELEKQKNALEESKTLLQSDHLALKSSVDSAKREFQHHMESQVKSKLLDMKKQYKHSIEKEKKRADLYKSKATQAHQQIRQLAAIGEDADS